MIECSRTGGLGVAYPQGTGVAASLILVWGQVADHNASRPFLRAMGLGTRLGTGVAVSLILRLWDSMIHSKVLLANGIAVTMYIYMPCVTSSSVYKCTSPVFINQLKVSYHFNGLLILTN